MEQHADMVMDERIERSDYDPADLVEIRIAMDAPYLNDIKAEYEEYEGNIEVDDVEYKCVKRKIENGDLYLLCLPNNTKSTIRNSNVDFVRLVYDLNHLPGGKEKQSAPPSIKLSTTEYAPENNDWNFPSVEQSALYCSIINNLNRSRGFPDNVLQPPR